MTAEDHIIAWIESSRPHYDILLEIERFRKYMDGNPSWRAWRAGQVIEKASHLVGEAYREMIRGGDASRDDPYSPADLAKAVMLVVAWELEQ